MSFSSMIFFYLYEFGFPFKKGTSYNVLSDFNIFVLKNKESLDIVLFSFRKMHKIIEFSFGKLSDN